jgi:nucleoside-diphosphate-sugar epimerase
MGARWLITGAQGFIGRYLSAHILASDPGAVVLGIGRSALLSDSFTHLISTPSGRRRAPLTEALRQAFDHRFNYRTAHVENRDQITTEVMEFKPDFVMHLAAGLRGDRTADLIQNNITGTESLMRSFAGLAVGPPKVLIASTGGVYGDVDSSDLPLRESQPCRPANDYSRSKLLAEQSACKLGSKYGIPLAVARIFNVIGPGQDERHVAARIAVQLVAIRHWMAESLQLGQLSSTRDFIDVRDVAQALVIIAAQGEGLFNVGSGVECPVSELVDEFCAVSGIAAPVQMVSDVPTGVLRNVADVSRIREMGFEAAFALRSSVHAVWDYYKRNWRPSCTPQ